MQIYDDLSSYAYTSHTKFGSIGWVPIEVQKIDRLGVVMFCGLW